MLINGGGYVADLQRKQAVQPSGAVSGTTAADAASGGEQSQDPISLSSQAKDIARYHQLLAALPDVRLDRVALAKQQVQQGGYGVDADLLAEKMLGGAGS